MYTTANDVRFQSATAVGPSTSARWACRCTHLIIEFARKVRQTARASMAHAERGFADFAKIPYCDPITQCQLIEILDECQKNDEEQGQMKGVQVIRYPLANRVLIPTVRRRCLRDS
jgi:hypothetical protein